jgi:alpha-L-fucosidase
MTMNTSWGYKHYDHNWKSPETLIRMLVDIASKGGNLLLNVGPTAEGEIPAPSVERLKAIGQWMAVNGESIYGTEASPFFKLPWGRCTSRKTSGGSILYLHVFNWPGDKVLRVPGISAKVRSTTFLADPSQKLDARFEEGDLLIDLPAQAPDPVNTVIVLETEGEPEVKSNMPALSGNQIVLPADFADIHNPGYGTHAILEGSGAESKITNWVDSRVRLEWMFHAEPGSYNVRVQVKSNKRNRLTITVGEEELVAEIQKTDGKFEDRTLGEINLAESGDLLISFRPVQEGWNGIELGSVKLIRQ